MNPLDIVSQTKFDNDLGQVIAQNDMFKIKADSELPIGYGSTFDYMGLVRVVAIGTKCRSSDGFIRGRDFTTALVALYHEIGHARQVEYEFNKQNDLSMVLAVNHFAQKCSVSYYDVQRMDAGNYTKHPTEIAAQYYGLRMAYRHLSKTVDPESANTLICDYVNNKVDLGFIPVDKSNPYTDVSQIFDKYNEVFNKCVRKHRSFNPHSNCGDTYDKFGTTKMTMMLQNPRTSGLRQDIILTKLFLDTSEEGGRLRDIEIGKNLVKAIGNVDFDKVTTPIVGNKHVSAVSRIDLDTLVPASYDNKNKSDNGFGFG